MPQTIDYAALAEQARKSAPVDYDALAQQARTAPAAPSTPKTPESWADWAINKLPVAGGIGGGIAGSVLGPAGTVVGGLFGAGGAEAYKELINRARGRPAPSTPTEAAQAVAKEGVWQGAVPEAVGLG